MLIFKGPHNNLLETEVAFWYYNGKPGAGNWGARRLVNGLVVWSVTGLWGISGVKE
jgi:hypothetical protein